MLFVEGAIVTGDRQRYGDEMPNVAPHGRRDSDVPCRRLVGRRLS